MPSVGSQGQAFADAAGSVDAPGIAAWGGFAGVLATWVSTFIVIPGTLVGASGVIGGAGIATTSTNPGAALAASVGSVDVVGLANWNAIGAVLIATPIMAIPSGMSSPPLGGPVAGVGRIFFASGSTLGDSLADAAGSVDAAGIEGWNRLADSLVNWLEEAVIFSGVGMIAPAGGPVTGLGKLL